MTPAMTQFGVGLGQMVIMVMAALAVTTEYRFGTIRTSFQAVPQRAALLLNKTIVVATLSAVVGLAARGARGRSATCSAPRARTWRSTPAEWRLMFGQAFVYALRDLRDRDRHPDPAERRCDRDPDPLAAAGREPAAADPEDRRRPAEVDAVHQREQFLNGEQDMGLAGADAAGASTALSPWWALVYFAAWAIAC